jgi:hypothetical protein
MTWKSFISDEKKLWKSEYYWLKNLMTILACALTITISFWLYAIFVLCIWVLIDNEYAEDLPFKEHDRILVRESDCMHDYYFVRYADKNQVQAYVTVFPGGEASFERLVDVNNIRKER